MKTHNFILAIFLSSILGGIIAISGYKIFNPETKQQASNFVTSVNQPDYPSLNFTKYSWDSADLTAASSNLNFVGAAKLSTPSVVHIKTSSEFGNTTMNNSPFDNFFRYYFDDGKPKNSEAPKRRGSGSGVIFSNDGYIVTNNHVIENAEEIVVMLNDNRKFDAKVIGIDPNTDLAVIKIEADDLTPVQWGNSDDLQIGEWVLAIGNPYEFRSTVTAGIVSAKARNISILNRQSARGDLSIESFIQTDAAVNPGNSGGALVNLQGKLIGINTAIASPTGSYAGYSFAVPVTLVRKITKDLVEYGVAQRPLLGVQIVNVNEVSEEEDIDLVKGIYINGVNENSAADIAGIKKGDVIIAVNGKEVVNVSELQETVALKRPGDEVEVTYVRNGEKRTVTAQLKNSAGNMEMVTIESENSFLLDGATFEDLSKEEKDEFDIEYGVKVKELNEGKWKEAGMKAGFIITKVDKKPIKNVGGLAAILKAVGNEGITVEGYTKRGEKVYYGIGW